MKNPKYYQDIKNFPKQFDLGKAVADTVDLSAYVGNSYRRIVLAGMGGSSLAGEVVNNMLQAQVITVHSDYDLPADFDSKRDLLVVASYSGNTEETISSLEAAVSQEAHPLVFSAGGKLTAMAAEHSLPVFALPAGIQPRLSTGYFFAFLFVLAQKFGLADVDFAAVSAAFAQLDTDLNEDFAKQVAASLPGKSVIVYSDASMWALARVVKIKFNENAKVQSFWNYFPELNHNEMVGYTTLTANPAFLLLRSKFGHPRNLKRMDIFTQLLTAKGCPVTQIELPGKTLIAEMLNAYYLADHITYFLAEAYDIDPEPVAMVEDFKQMLVG